MQIKKSEIINKIKQKKEFLGLADSVVSGIVEKNLSKVKIREVEDKLEYSKEFQIKELVKLARSQLRRYTGMFQVSSKNRVHLLKSSNINLLFKTHQSTKERIDFYPVLKKKIKDLKISSILDLGCGLNPVAIAEKGVFYFASDIRNDELDLIKDYFKSNKISGKTFIFDLNDASKFSTLPKADLCLLLKVFDLLDDKRAIAQKVFSELPCNYFIISFSTRKLSGRIMNQPRRLWFEDILLKFNLNYETFHSDNEIFYFIKSKLTDE